ncbi:MAG: zinc ribbon domain-containing protein [Gammaproteobacteria bacterium]|nr:zinc ribbon domain-containing protein [Gammaproteobacteria bacterium]
MTMSRSDPMQDLTPPLPRPTPTSRPFWDGLDAGRVRLQQCTACAGWVFYPRNRCPQCLSGELVWNDVAGTGVLYTWTVCERPTAPHFASWGTYVLAVVELEESVRMTTLLARRIRRNCVRGCRSSRSSSARRRRTDPAALPAGPGLMPLPRGPSPA